MKPMVLDGSACRRSPSRVAVILTVLVSLLCFSLILFNSLSQAADDQASKAVRRSASDQRRVALVIGNSDYKVGPLQNPAHDAEDISGVLRTLGFAVQTKTNVNHLEMEEAVDRFVQEIQNGDVALFYFSGHGVQVKGENYLIPLGDSIKSETDVRYKTVNAGLILGKMEESRNRANIVILDACRNNPFKGLFRSASTGLSKMDAPKGTFIAYATSPDSVAADGTSRNSPYTKALMEALRVKDIPIEQAFKQVGNAVNKETGGQQTPWILSSLLDDFYFYPSSLTSSLVKPSDGGKTESEQEVAKLREAERVAALERERLEKAKREHEQEIARLREAEKVAALEKDKLEKQRLEREVREREQELAKLREAQRIAALEKERLEKEKQEMLREREREKQQERERIASLPAPTPPRPSASAESEVAKLQRLANQGDAEAQYRLGDLYKYGRGVDRNYDQAVKWYRKAADQGNAGGQNGVGWWYEYGPEATRDNKEAVMWFRKAAEQEDANGQNSLAFMYSSGKGVAKDHKEAVKWWRKAAEKEHLVAEYHLGLAYKRGEGVAKNQAEARKWITKAADRGWQPAKEELQNLGATSSK